MNCSKVARFTYFNKIKNDYKALLICSDGLHGYVSEAIIREILESARSVEDKVRLLIDKAILEQEFLGCHPCINTSSLKIRTSDIIEIFLPCINHAYTLVDLPDDQN